MNISLKVALAAALSAMAVSVAALSVPAVKVYALKLIGDLGIDQALVTNVTIKKPGVPDAPAMNPPVAVGFRDVSVEAPPAPADEHADGVLGAFGGGHSNNQDATPNGLRSLRGDGMSSIGPGTSGPGVGGARAGSAAPGEDLVAFNDGGSSPSSGGTGNTPPARDVTAPGGPGKDDFAGLAPEPDIFKDVADLLPQPDDDLGDNPDTALNTGPAAQPLVVVAAVPEPGTLALLGVALLGVGAFRRQRARR